MKRLSVMRVNSSRSLTFIIFLFLAASFAQLSPISGNAADLSSFSVFATNSVWVRQGATVNSGNIGVNDASPGPWLDSQSEVTIGKSVYVADGISIYGDTVKIKLGASVADVHYNELNNNGTIRGAEYTPLELPLDVPLPEFPTPAPGTENYDIPRGETLILDPGSYGEITVRENATLFLTGGTYHLEELILGYPNAKVLFQGATDLIINNRLDPGQKAHIGPGANSGISARDIRIYVNGINGTTGNLGATPKAAVIGYDNILQANIYAPNGTLLIKQGTVAEGAFIAKDVKIGLNVQVTLNSGFGKPVGAVTVNILANPSSIVLGESSTLSWTSTNADSATIDQGIGDVPVEGSITVSPTRTTTYTITATGPGGTATDEATVTVRADVEPQPEGSFGAQYEDLIPPDATVGSYDPKRFSLITALVRDLGGLPIGDVSVTILDHSEYGSTITDAGGRFSIPVEGGGVLTVVYQKEGLITAHRKVYVPWNDIAIADTIVMIPQDPASTTITFDGNPNTVITHQSTEVADEFGSRSCTMVFTGDHRAFEVDADGNIIRELTTITTRATEFITPDSMPAKLPPTSLYTYCVELGVDGAQRVKFNKPAVSWVDNFLGFDIGEAVPIGFYDRDQGVWVPSKNGVVVKLLDTDTDGVVDAVDAIGDDQPDDLDGDGSFSDEVAGLSDSQRYPPGSSFWRFAVTHFTPWDCNWPYGPPADAVAPNPGGGPSSDEEYPAGEDCYGSTSSHVTERSRVFHEDIPIPGTDVTLHYASSRVKGYHPVITVPVSGETVPASLKRINVRLEVAGRSLEQILDPVPNQVVEFVWDRLDHLGRPVSGSVTAHVGVGFVYEGVYLTAGDFALAFAQPGGEWTAIRAREEVISWRLVDLKIPKAPTGTAIIAGGWTLSVHHSLRPWDLSTLYKGDGTVTRSEAHIIYTVAGNGIRGYSGDEGPATEAELYGPDGVALDASGNLYIADTYNNCVRKVDPSGIITTVAGNGTRGYSGDGGPATEAQLDAPEHVALDGSGNLYVADSLNNRIRKVDLSGIITTVAGNGTSGYSGDEGPATEAQLNYPCGVALDASGNLYIADRFNNRVRKVDPSGIITTVAGNGTYGHSGDGGPATEAQLGYPWGVNVDGSGNLYIADTYNDLIRKVDVSGIITTVAGNGTSGYSGDEGPATEAQLNFPCGVAVDTSGNLYIADTYNSRIRKVDPSGIITTVAGNGTSGYSGDEGPATEAQLAYPWGVALDASGNLYIADYNNDRIRKVIPISAFMIGGDIAFAEEEGVAHILSTAGHHKWTTDLDTGVVLREFGYDDNNNLISITDRFGNQITIARDGSGVPTAITSQDGITTALAIDANAHLTRITYSDTSFYGFEYTPNGLMTAKIEPEGNRFEHVFDPTGRLTDATDQEGGHWHYSRSVDAMGDILTEVLTAEADLTSYLDHYASTGAYTSTITDPTGAQTVFTRSDDGLSVDKSLPCGMELAFEYDVDSKYKFRYVKEMVESTPLGLGRITFRDKTYQDTDMDDIPDLIGDQVTVNGKVTTFETDTLQSKKTLTLPEGRTVTAFYDPDTLLITNLLIPGFYETTYWYDPRGRLTSISTNTRETTFTYDEQGNLSSVIDPGNHTTTYTYDAVGRMTGINRPDGSSLGFTYDKNGNMTVLRKPSAIGHGFGYNGVNLNTSYQTPLSGTYSYFYDRDRRLMGINFPSGKQINLIYDKGRLVQIQTPEGDMGLAYLCGTKVGSITKGIESISYGYDGSLLTSETLSGTLNQSLSYTYNNDFYLASFAYAGGTVEYDYDDDGLLTGAGNFAIARNVGNGLPEEVYGGPLSLTRTFNGYAEVEGQDFAINGNNVTSCSLSRDNAGRIIAKTETVDGITSDYEYTYDPMGRLLTVTKDGTLVEEYEYGPNGTRTYQMNSLRGIAGRTMTYSDEDHLLTAGDGSYQYDLDGFLTTKTEGTDVTTYQYSSLGELLSVTLPNGKVIEYVHDPFGRRTAKEVDGVMVEKYLWQGLTRLQAVYDKSDNLVMRFEYADGRMPLAMTRGGSVYYLTYDQVGSLRIIADSSGNVIKRIDYDSFGSIINDTNPSFTIPFGFAGGLHDRDTGLVRLGFRDYNPDIGRWAAKDPILFAGGSTDLYGYCLNDPINLIDSDGLKVEAPVGSGAPLYLVEILKKLAEGSVEAAKGIKAVALDDYEFYKDTEKSIRRPMHLYPSFKCVDWNKYGETFEEAWDNWLKEVLEGKFEPCK